MVSTDKSAAMTGFLDEVKRRKVYQVAAAYIIAAGGIIQLGTAPGDRAATDGLSNSSDPGLGVRHHSAGCSRNASAGCARIASAQRHSHACTDRCDHFRRCRVLSAAAPLGPQVRQIDRGVAV